MIDREVKAFLLKALLAAGKPVTEDFLRGAVASAFIQVTFTSHELRNYIAQLEQSGYLAGINDDVLGLVWALTPAGKIKAQQL
jgi:hypothetical protein